MNFEGEDCAFPLKGRTSGNFRFSQPSVPLAAFLHRCTYFLALKPSR